MKTFVEYDYEGGIDVYYHIYLFNRTFCIAKWTICCFFVLQKAHLMIRVRDEVEDGDVVEEEGPGVEVRGVGFH